MKLQVEKDDMKEKIENASWICMRIYMVNDHIRHSYLLGIQKMTKSSTTENIYEIVIDSLEEIDGMDHSMIAKGWYVLEQIEHQ